MMKKLFYRYKAQALVVDGNGMGTGLVDFLVKSQVDPDSGDTLPDFGVINDESGEYKRFHTDITEYDSLYIIKANSPINTEAHTYLQSQMSSGKLKLLIDERTAKAKLMGTKIGQSMRPEERAEYLRPFTLTSILREELLNLREETQGINIILKQANKSIGKDKFSSLEYGLYYIKLNEDSKKKKRGSISNFMFMN